MEIWGKFTLKKEKGRLHGYRYVMVSSHMKIYLMGGYGISTCEAAYIRGIIFVLCANVQACVRACVCFDGRTLPSAVWGVRFPGKKRYKGVRFKVSSNSRVWVGVN